MSLRYEAEKCRRNARILVGKPEVPFLLKMADAFDALALQEGLQVARDKR